MTATTTTTRSKWPVRVGLALAVGVYLVYSSFGLLAPFWWGHHGYHGAQYLLRARMSLRLHTIYPITWSGFDPTYPQNALYFHHPIALHHLLTLTVPIFGDHEWLARLVGVVGGLLAIWSLYRLAARFWSREAGLLAVVLWVSLPFVCSFSVLCDAMFWECAAVLWMLHAYLLVYERPDRRTLALAFGAAAFGGLFMWEVFFVAPFLALHAASRRFTREGRALTIGRWNALTLHTVASALGCALVLGFHLLLTMRAGAFSESVDAYNVRKSASPAWVLDRHNQWIDLLYGNAPVLLGAAWLALFLVRATQGRARRRDLAPLTFLYVNVIYYYLFSEGSAVHLYRVFFYSGFFVLGGMDLIVSAAAFARRLAGRSAAPAVALALTLVYLVADVPHARANLLESRELMGTHGEVGYNPQRDKTLFAQEVNRRTTRDDRVIIDYRHLGARKEFWYYIDRSFDEISWLSELGKYEKTLPRSVLLLDFAQLDANERRRFVELAGQHPVTFFDHFVMVDFRSNAAQVTSYAFVDGKMTRGYRWWVSHKYPPLGLEPSAFLPGVCAALDGGASPAPDLPLPPGPPPRGLVACWHNLLAARGDAHAAGFEEQLTRGLAAVGQRLGAAQVLAAQVQNHHLTVAYRAEGPEKGELRYRLTPPGGAPQLLARAQVAPPGRWQSGWLYLDQVTLPRTGGELEVELTDGPQATVLAHVHLASISAPPAPPPPPPKPKAPVPVGKPLVPGGKPLVPVGKPSVPVGKPSVPVGKPVGPHEGVQKTGDRRQATGNRQ